MALIWLQGLELDVSGQTNKNKDFNLLIFHLKIAKLIKKRVNMFQMIAIFTLESKFDFIKLGFGTYYEQCVMQFLTVEIYHYVWKFEIGNF